MLPTYLVRQYVRKQLKANAGALAQTLVWFVIHLIPPFARFLSGRQQNSLTEEKGVATKAASLR